MTEEELKEQTEARQEIASMVVEELKAQEVVRNFVPAGEDGVTVDHDAEKIKQTGGYDEFYQFAVDLRGEGESGHNRSEKLTKWAEVSHNVEKITGLGEADASDGGYLVPETFRAELLKLEIEASIVKSRAVKIPMATNRVSIPAVIVSSHASSLFGGVVIYRPEEGGSKTASKPAFGRVALTLHKLVGLVYGTDELLEDSPISLQPLLTTMFSEAIAYTEDSDFLTGDGVNKALGVFSTANPCRIQVDKENSQDGSTIVAENILKMWARVYPKCKGKGIWLTAPDTFSQLAGMSLPVGTGGIPIWMPAGGLSGAPYQTLMGRPLIETEKMATLGTAGDIGFADFSQYLIGEKGGIKTASSIHLKFDYDETAFRFVLRYDGQPWWQSALTPKNSGDSTSPFVMLAVRS